MVDETSNTLLEAIRHSPDDERWQRLVELYTPFIRGILSSKGVKGHEAEDLVQNVLVVVVRRLPEFDRQRVGSFRSWLRSITVNTMRDHWRAAGRNAAKGNGAIQDLANQLDDPRSELSQQWDAEHNRYVLCHLLDQVKNEFQENTFRAFHQQAVEGKEVEEIATELEMSVNAVYIARSRVMKRLREIGAELLD